ILEVCAIFTRVVITGSVPGGMSNTAASMFGFFSIRMAIASVLASALLIPTGTTAPFSAISGVWKKVTSLLGAGSAPPSACIASARLRASNAVLFHDCARDASGGNHPAAASRASRVTLPPDCNAFLRPRFIVDHLYQTQHCRRSLARRGSLANGVLAIE